jgi:hypothetical protein
MSTAMLLQRKPAPAAAMFRDMIQEAVWRARLKRICSMTMYTNYPAMFFFNCLIYMNKCTSGLK